MSEPVATWVLDRLAKTQAKIAALQKPYAKLVPEPIEGAFKSLRAAVASMETKRTCVRCGTEFYVQWPHGQRQRYCDKVCRLAASNEARQMTDDPTRKPARQDFWRVLNAVEATFRIGKADIQSERRSHHIAVPRHMAMAALRHIRPDVSLPRIGVMFGRDHSTVIHAIEQNAKRLADPAYAAKWQAVLEKLGANHDR